MNRRFSLCVLFAVCLGVVLPSSSLASGRHKQHFSGVVRSISVARHTVTIAVATASRNRRSKHSKLVTFTVSSAEIGGSNAALAVGDTVSVTTVGDSGHTPSATSIEVAGAPHGGGSHGGSHQPNPGDGGSTGGSTPPSTHVTGQVSAIRGDGFTVTVNGVSVNVSVSTRTSFDVADTNGDGANNLLDVRVGDTVYVQSYNASASPIVARGVADQNHPYQAPAGSPHA
jgi:hypothetical protein